MTPKQTIFYWREFAAWKRAREARGLPTADADRHALHHKALGAYKSSKAFTNRDLDRVLMAFRAESSPADLDAQIRLQEQAEARHAAVLEECMTLAADLTDWHSNHDVVDARSKRDRYLGTISRSVAKKAYEKCSARELEVVRGILYRRIHHLEHEALHAATRDEPF